MLGHNYLEYLDATQDRMAQGTREEFAQEVAIIAEGFKMLGAVLQGLNVRFEQNTLNGDPTTDIAIKSSLTTLALRVVKDLQASYMLLERGYFTEALSLCRDALETACIWKYLHLNHHETQRWFDSAYTDKGLSFSMATRATGDYDTLVNTYSFLCKFSHPSGMTYWSHLRFDGTAWLLSARKRGLSFLLYITQMFLRIILELMPGQIFADDDTVAEFINGCKLLATRLMDGSNSDADASLEEIRRRMHMNEDTGVGLF